MICVIHGYVLFIVSGLSTGSLVDPGCPQVFNLIKAQVLLWTTLNCFAAWLNLPEEINLILIFRIQNYFEIFKLILKNYEWKASVFGAIMARIFPHWDWIRREYFVSVWIQSECKKMRTIVSPNTGTFNAVLYSLKCQKSIRFWTKIDNSVKWQCQCFARNQFFN